jgi:hypothetical protein
MKTDTTTCGRREHEPPLGLMALRYTVQAGISPTAVYADSTLPSWVARAGVLIGMSSIAALSHFSRIAEQLLHLPEMTMWKARTREETLQAVSRLMHALAFVSDDIRFQRGVSRERMGSGTKCNDR